MLLKIFVWLLLITVGSFAGQRIMDFYLRRNEALLREYDLQVGRVCHIATLAAGVADEKIYVDPDFGFAKTPEQDWEILRRIDELHQLGPVVAGMSRKSFLGNFLEQPDPMQRLGGTVAAALYLADREVEILRVHDVRQVSDALSVWDKLR